MLGNRSVKQILSAITGKQHYIALINMMRLYPRFVRNLIRYLTASGKYPYDIKVRTPSGTVTPRLYTSHDLLTVNEIFCRLDYAAQLNTKVVIDIGSNIGISALYFMTRNDMSQCYLYEPDPNNLGKLQHNLKKYEDRYCVSQNAVGDKNGQFKFGIEDTGRYGGVGVETTESITVTCVNINQVIREVLKKHENIDIIKIDTEGLELATVQAIEEENLRHIKRIYIEAEPDFLLHPTTFTQTQYGSVCQLTNTAFK